MRALAWALVLAALAAAPEAGAGRTVTVRSDAGFAAAVERLRATGGTIVLAPRRYGTLAVGPRGPRRLTIVARPGASARFVRLTRTRAVTIAGLRVTPRGGQAQLAVTRSSRIALLRLRVTAGSSPYRARVRLTRSTRVRIAGGELSRCGDRTACITIGGGSRLTIEGNSFHDCFGCDFVRGRFGRFMQVRDNTFDRALPGACGREPTCNHQDLVQVGGGRGLVVERNRFGVYELGAAQVYLSGALDGAVVRTNVFVGTDPLLPGYAAPTGIVVGSNVEAAMPRGVVIAGNTILTGAWRPSGVENSVILSAHYVDVPVEDRPVLVNNVLGLVGTPERLCALAQATIANVVASGTGCSESDVVGELGLDEDGSPVAVSALTVDRADPAWATSHDILGVARDESPDVGAFEFVGP